MILSEYINKLSHYKIKGRLKTEYGFSDDLSHSLIPSLPYHSAQFFFLLVLPIPGLKLLVGSSLR